MGIKACTSGHCGLPMNKPMGTNVDTQTIENKLCAINSVNKQETKRNAKPMSNDTCRFELKPIATTKLLGTGDAPILAPWGRGAALTSEQAFA